MAATVFTVNHRLEDFMDESLNHEVILFSRFVFTLKRVGKKITLITLFHNTYTLSYNNVLCSGHHAPTV